MVMTVAQSYADLAWLEGGERFPGGAKVMLVSGSERRELAPGFAATADPSVSFDGEHVLFAGKKAASDPWQVWEVAVKGGEARRITNSAEDAIRPFYLPQDRVVYARKANGRFVLDTISIEDGTTLQLSYAPGNFVPADVLRDGRVLFASSYPLGSGSKTPELYTVYSDGSGVQSYRCDHEKGRYAGRQVSSGDIVFSEGDTLARFTSARAEEQAIAAPKGEYAGDVAETGSGEWIVVHRADPSKPYSLKRWKPGAPAMTAVFAPENVNQLQPMLVAPRAVPNRHPSGLHKWKTANLLTLNSYISRGKDGAADASIASVRVSGVDENGKPRVLGDAPVEKDGSFYVKIPGDTPVRFELLGKNGETLKQEKGYFWARGGEQRVCVGCHAGPERAPDNVVPEILNRSTTPADMTGGIAAAHTGGN